MCAGGGEGGALLPEQGGSRRSVGGGGDQDPQSLERSLKTPTRPGQEQPPCGHLVQRGLLQRGDAGDEEEEKAEEGGLSSVWSQLSEDQGGRQSWQTGTQWAGWCTPTTTPSTPTNPNSWPSAPHHPSERWDPQNPYIHNST